jgi:hypothetical protein
MLWTTHSTGKRRKLLGPSSVKKKLSSQLKRPLGTFQTKELARPMLYVTRRLLMPEASSAKLLVTSNSKSTWAMLSRILLWNGSFEDILNFC